MLKVRCFLGCTLTTGPKQGRWEGKNQATAGLGKESESKVSRAQTWDKDDMKAGHRYCLLVGLAEGSQNLCPLEARAALRPQLLLRCQAQ
jgi:hypothetical protein